MARGLEKILEKISENPRQTLVGRYLSLIADIDDEDERASYALSLAERLVGTKTNDALRIAYMVYDSGRHVVRALRIVIACFEDKGRAGKVAVLKLELAKLEKDLRQESPEESRRRQKPLPDLSSAREPSHGQFALDAGSEVPPPFREQIREQNPPREDTRMAELDLGELSQHDSAAEDAVDLLFPDRKEESFAQVEESRPLPELDLAEGFFANFAGRPGDTVLPGLPHRFADDPEDHAREDGSGTIVSRIVPKDQVKEKSSTRPPAQTVKLDDIPRITLDGPSRVSGFIPPPEPRQTRGSAPSEIFDRFLAAGKYAEAEVVLESSRADSHFEWWRIRRTQLDAAQQNKAATPLPSASSPQPLAAFAGPGPVTSTVANLSQESQPAEVTRPSREPVERPFTGDFRKGVTTEILRLSDLMARADLPGTQNQLKTLPDKISPFPTKLLQALQQQPLTSEAEKRRFFDLLQGISGGSGSEEFLQIIEQSGLARHSPAWFGFYLDCLLHCGFARKALAESVMISAGEQSLAWIRVIWQRLPAVWSQMGSAGFSWREEDGTKEFVNQIKKRPKPLLSQFLGL